MVPACFGHNVNFQMPLNEQNLGIRDGFLHLWVFHLPVPLTKGNELEKPRARLRFSLHRWYWKMLKFIAQVLEPSTKGHILWRALLFGRWFSVFLKELVLVQPSSIQSDLGWSISRQWRTDSVWIEVYFTPSRPNYHHVQQDEESWIPKKPTNVAEHVNPSGDRVYY